MLTCRENTFGASNLTRPVHILVALSVIACCPAVRATKLSEAQNAAVSTRIATVAKASLGKEMWKGYGLPNGTLGCAAALCNVLKKAGIERVSSPIVTAMRRQLLTTKVGCTERIIRNGEGQEIDDAILLKECRPGDILLAFSEPPNKLNGGANAHCGIMGQGTHIYTNNWNDGIWTDVEIHQMFDYYPYIRLLRLGANTSSKVAH